MTRCQMRWEGRSWSFHTASRVKPPPTALEFMDGLDYTTVIEPAKPLAVGVAQLL